MAFEDVAAVESVTIGKGGLTISLVNGAVLATSLNGNFGGGPRINLYRPTPDSQPGTSNAADAVRLRKQLASQAGEAELKTGGGKAIAGAGTPEPIKDVGRLVREYGGRAGDWGKIASRSYPVGDGTSRRWTTWPASGIAFSAPASR